MMKKLGLLNVDIVNKVPLGSHSVAQLVQHITNWRVFAIEKLKGNAQYDIELNSTSDWPDRIIDSKSEWQLLLKQLDETQQTIIALLGSKDDDFLKEQVPGRNYSYAFLLEGIVQHDVYHLGQIGIVAKQVRAEYS